MIIYNVTIKVDRQIHEAWLQWLQTVHIPEVLATECFTDCRVLRLLEIEDTDGPTYAVQYNAATPEMYERYIAQHAGEMRRRSFEKWGGKFAAFRSVMEVVN